MPSQSADYLNMTTTSIAGSSGDGAVTMTALSGSPGFTDVFGSGKVWVNYQIEDPLTTPSTKLFERGIGSVTSNVLTRTKPTYTTSGSTVKPGPNGASVVALQFGSTPTSGNVIIRLGADAENRFPSVDVRQNSIAGDANWRDYVISGHIVWSNNGAGTTLTANRVYYAAHKLETPGLLSGIQLEVTTNVAASTIPCALYDFGSNGLPGAKIVDFTGFNSATTGIKTDTATGSWTPANKLNLMPGWYVIGFTTAATGVAIRQTAARALCITPYGRADGYGWADLVYEAGSGTMPATPAPTTIAGSAAAVAQPWIGLKVV